MLTLFVITLVVFFSVGIVLWAGTLGLQGYIYSEPASDLYWRAPLAGGIMALFLGLWCVLDYRGIDPGQNDIPFETIFRFNPTELNDVDQFTSVMSYKSVKKPEENERIVYKRRNAPTGPEFLDPQGRPWKRDDTQGIVEAIAVDEKGQELLFKPKLVEVRDPNSPEGKRMVFPRGSPEFPGYYQVGGRRKMLQLGQVSVFRWGLFLGNLLLNAFLFALWFVCLWLLLRFQWVHAFGLAVVFWLITTLVGLPMLLGKTQEVARQRTATASIVHPANELVR